MFKNNQTKKSNNSLLYNRLAYHLTEIFKIKLKHNAEKKRVKNPMKEKAVQLSIVKSAGGYIKVFLKKKNNKKKTEILVSLAATCYHPDKHLKCE